MDFTRSMSSELSIRVMSSRLSGAIVSGEYTYPVAGVTLEAAVIDIVDALELLDSCVRDRGAGYRSTHRRGSAGSFSRRHPACRTATDSIVTLVLTKAGTPLAAVSQVARTSVDDAYASGGHDLNLTVGAVAVLRAAQSMERRGETWGRARQAAAQAASRFAELVLPAASGSPSAG
jgi:hypothetical protein